MACRWKKKPQMQKICALWGHGGVREFASQPSCYTKLLEALTPRVRLSQTPGSWKLLSHSPGTGWASRCLASEGTKFHSGFAPHVRSRTLLPHLPLYEGWSSCSQSLVWKALVISSCLPAGWKALGFISHSSQPLKSFSQPEHMYLGVNVIQNCSDQKFSLSVHGGQNVYLTCMSSKTCYTFLLRSLISRHYIFF